jgi:nucleolar complex protein 3
MRQQFPGESISFNHRCLRYSYIYRSKKETERLFNLTKTPYARVEHVREPSLDGSASENSEWNSSIEELDLSDEPSESEALDEQSSLADSDEEQSYERLPRKVEGTTKEAGKKQKMVSRLPIKLPSGQIQQTGVREGSARSDEDMEEEADALPQKHTKPTKRDFAGARFGRASVADIIRIGSRPDRIQSAKEQIAGICQDIMSEPENGVSNLCLAIKICSHRICATS